MDGGNVKSVNLELGKTIWCINLLTSVSVNLFFFSSLFVNPNLTQLPTVVLSAFCS